MTPDKIAESIPDEVVEAARNSWRFPDEPLVREWCRAGLAAGLAAWPKAFVFSFPGSLEDGEESSQDLILPLKKGDVS